MMCHILLMMCHILLIERNNALGVVGGNRRGSGALGVVR